MKIVWMSHMLWLGSSWYRRVEAALGEVTDAPSVPKGSWRSHAAKKCQLGGWRACQQLFLTRVSTDSRAHGVFSTTTSQRHAVTNKATKCAWLGRVSKTARVTLKITKHEIPRKSSRTRADIAIDGLNVVVYRHPHTLERMFGPFLAVRGAIMAHTILPR